MCAGIYLKKKIVSRKHLPLERVRLRHKTLFLRQIEEAWICSEFERML